MDLGYTLAVSRVKFLAGKSVRASLIVLHQVFKLGNLGYRTYSGYKIRVTMNRLHQCKTSTPGTGLVDSQQRFPQRKSIPSSCYARIPSVLLRGSSKP